MGTLGEQTRRLMAARGVSLRSLARQTSYDVGYLSRALNGRQKPSQDLVEAIDHALDADGALIALAGARPAADPQGCPHCVPPSRLRRGQPPRTG